MRFALVGNPNSGKTTLFNALTGSTAHVGNWPGVTVDKREGEYKKLPEKVDIIDLPGIYSMSPYTPEEVISRDFVLKENPDCIINIVDCTNLERNLYLTTQLLELDTPVVVALNMSDVLQKNGDKIDIEALEKAISVPVVAISALKEKGIAEVMERGYKVAKEGRKGFSPVEESEISSIL
ncbi:MAG: FeoB small GTPase domain-containing protein, partial [Firmicutes bacterium]|nr:FeoB small GTPase domain-containing protein [Bacillota bacterium]